MIERLRKGFRQIRDYVQSKIIGVRIWWHKRKYRKAVASQIRASKWLAEHNISMADFHHDRYYSGSLRSRYRNL